MKDSSTLIIELEKALGWSDDTAVSSGKEISVVSDYRTLVPSKFPFTVPEFQGLVIMRGSMKCTIDMVERSTEGTGMFMIMPLQVLGSISFSDDFQAKIVTFSREFIDSINVDGTFVSMFSMKEAPFIKMDDMMFASLCGYVANVRMSILSSNPRRFDIVRHLCRAAYYSLWYSVDKKSIFAADDHGTEVSRQFINMVHNDCLKHRDMDYYASRLSISPKTLYALVKAKTNTAPSRLIADYTILKAKHILRTTDKTIGQISDMFAFRSQSDFGKYFKRETGMSPKAYRKSAMRSNIEPEGRE